MSNVDKVIDEICKELFEIQQRRFNGDLTPAGVMVAQEDTERLKRKLKIWEGKR